jgi:hypothetical protein
MVMDKVPLVLTDYTVGHVEAGQLTSSRLLMNNESSYVLKSLEEC